MTPKEQFIACAELDGLCVADSWSGVERRDAYVGRFCNVCGVVQRHSYPNYDSYDVLIPLIIKLCDNDNSMSCWTRFFNFLSVEVENKDHLSIQGLANLFKAKPAQLRQALLRATGKWKD